MANAEKGRAQAEKARQDELDDLVEEASESLAVRVARELRHDIGEGGYAPHQRLKEVVLAERYTATRAAVREALKALETEGLVQYSLNQGFAVAEMTLPVAQDIYEAREVLEGLAGRLFTQRATASQIAELKETLAAYAAATDIPEDEPGRLDMLMKTKNAFYEIIHHGCGNVVVYELLETLRHRIWYLRRKTLSHNKRPEQTLKELQAIVDAVAAADAELAERASKDHVRFAARVAYNELQQVRFIEAGKRRKAVKMPV